MRGAQVVLGLQKGELGPTVRPMPGVHDPRTYGYTANDLALTRFGVTGQDGRVTFGELPAGSYHLEVVIPTASFRSSQMQWELWLASAAAPWGPAPTRWRAPIQIAEGADVHHPILELRPCCTLSLADWQPLDRDGFRLEWTVHPKAARHVLTMSLSCPDSLDDAEFAEAIHSEETETQESSVEIGGEGGVGLALHPGNVYLFRVRSLSASGQVVAQSSTHRAFVPWNHRVTLPPYPTSDRPLSMFHGPPIARRNWHAEHFYSRETGEETSTTRLERYLEGAEDDFEYPYARVVRAWLRWHEDDLDRAREELELLVTTLPRHNVARETAAALVASLANGEAPVRELWFIGSGE